MKILFIGGTGEISTACVWRSVEAGHDVTIFNRGRTEEALPEAVHRITGDMDDAAAYEALGKANFDAVCQFVAYDMARVERDVQVFGGRCGQYIFISTASAYQKPPTQYVITEAVPLANPFWPYSQAKADMEAYLTHRHAEERLPVTIVRPAHTLRTRFPGGIATGDDWAWRMLNSRPVIVHGDGTGLWTLTCATDFAYPFVNLFGKKKALGEAFHITRHIQASMWNHIFEAMGRALRVQPHLVHVPAETLVRYDPAWAGPLLGDKVWPVLYDNSKVMSVAGKFECKVSMEECLRRAAEHYGRRAAAYKPDPARHALLDRVAEEQLRLGANAQ